MTTPIKDKKMMTVRNYFSDIMLKFGFPRILHSDNDKKFKYKFIENLSQQIGIKRHISPHQLQGNGKLESSHRFIKGCFSKFSVGSVLVRDQLLPYATATFNWFPNEHCQEPPHFLYFGYDPY